MLLVEAIEMLMYQITLPKMCLSQMITSGLKLMLPN